MSATLISAIVSFVTLGSFIVTGIVWLVRLDSTVDTNKKLVDQQYKDLETLIKTKFEGQDEKFKGLGERIGRVELGVDSLRERY